MRQHLKTFVLLGALSAGLVAIGGLLGQGYMYLFTGLALLMNLGAYFFSDRLVLMSAGAREVSREAAPGLHAIVEELSARAGIPKPRVYVVDAPHANAFATGRSPERGVVAVTTGILDILSPRELRGVLAHELGHIKNRDILVSSIAAALATAISSIANAFQWNTLLGGGSDDGEETSPAGGLLFALLAPIAATLVQLGISRSREYLADETGAQISGDPGALASALAKLESAAHQVPGDVQPATASLYIVNPFAGLGGALTRLFATHPPMADRIGRLHEMAAGRWAA